MAKEIADVLIIGSGASGGPFAWFLSQLAGVKVVCLEQGDWPEKATYSSNGEGDGQRQRLTTPPSPQAGVRHFRNGYPYDYTQSDWQPILGHAVGGGSVHYSAVWARLHPSDFVARSLDGVADNWPITYWDLAPYYDLNDRTVGVAGIPGNTAYPPAAADAERQPPVRLSRNAQILSRGFKKLGWHWWPTDQAILTRPHRGRKPCLTGCATCDDGCPRNAKNSSDVVYWPEAIKNGVVLKTRARVREVTVNARGLADGVVYYDADGRLQQQKARVVVIACNGVGTPRLLLNSKSKLFPHGLANSSGLVGKGLMGHPGAGATGQFDSDQADPRGDVTNGLCSAEHCESDVRRGFARGFWWLSTGYQGPVTAALGEPQMPTATLTPPALRSPYVNASLRWGASHHRVFQDTYSHTVSASALLDELPEDANRVELHPTLTDDVGVPAAKIIHRVGENTAKMGEFVIERAKEVLQAAGATKITATRKATPGAHHLLGTARMGADPRRSVVDQWGRAHDVKNLFIIDGSVFPTSGSCTPTSTIQALALRTADYLKKNSREVLGS